MIVRQDEVPPVKSFIMRRNNAMKTNCMKALSALAAVALSFLVNNPVQAGNKPGTTLASVNNSGVKGNSNSNNPALSADGRYVAFVSTATNLADGGGSGFWEIFVRDTVGGTTDRITVSASGGNPDGNSSGVSLSSDGRYVAFSSNAANLVEGDTNGMLDVFVRDRVSGTTEMVSTNANKTSFFPSISADGRYVAFASLADNLVAGDTNNAFDIFVKDRRTGVIERITGSGGVESDNESRYPAISADGRYVAFLSYAANLVPGDTNGSGDIFVFDRTTGIVQRASVSSNGDQADSRSVDIPAISADGRYVAFTSHATNLVPGDTNGVSDVFIRDTAAAITEMVSVSSKGVAGDNSSRSPSISADGRYVAFNSYAGNFSRHAALTVNVFYRDRTAGSTDLVVAGNNGSSWPSISGNGLIIAFQSYSTNLVSGDTDNLSDIFARAR